MSPISKRLLAFTTAGLASALAPLTVLPLIARQGGESVWGAFAIGQGLGVVAATGGSLGWSLSGAARVARLRSTDERLALYRVSVRQRIVATAISLALLLPLSFILARNAAPEFAILLTLSTSLSALSLTWFCVGIGRPSLLFRYEVGPRLVAALASVPILATTQAFIIYPVFTIVATLAGLLVFHLKYTVRSYHATPADTDLVPDASLRYATATNYLGTGWSAALLPLGSLFLEPTNLAIITSADRVYRYSMFAIVAMANSIQHWVSQASQERLKPALVAHTWLAILGGGALTFMGPIATVVLFGQSLGASSGLFVGYGVTFAATSVSTALIRLILQPRLQDRIVFMSTLVGVGCGGLLMSATFFWLQEVSLIIALAVGDLVAMGILIRFSIVSRATKE